MIRANRIDLQHPRVVQMDSVLVAAGSPMRLTDLGNAVFPGAANAAAMAASYLPPLMLAGRVKRVGWGLYVSASGDGADAENERSV